MTPLDELDQVLRECSFPNWDGYGAEPVSHKATEHARRLLGLMPVVWPVPSVGAEPDGCVTLDWHAGRKCLSISVLPSGGLAWAGLGLDRRLVGEVKQFDSVPDALTDAMAEMASKV